MSLAKQDVVLQQLEEQLKDYKTDYDKSQKQSSERRKCLMTIAEKVCDSKYGNMQLGGRNDMIKQTDFEIRDFIIRNVLDQKMRYTQSIIDLQKLYINEQREKEELANQVLKLREELVQAQNAYQNAIQANQTSNLGQMAAAAGVGAVGGAMVGAMNSHQNAKPEVDTKMPGKKDSNILINGSEVYDITKEYNKVNVYQLAILNAIGTFGYSETNDIVSECMKHVEAKETFIRQNINELVDFKMLTLDKISTPIRKTLSLYGLSDLGKAIYKKEYDKTPVKCEKVRLVEMHASINHAYCIKDTCKILGDLGYTNISMDAIANTIDVASSRRYVPDIIANFDSKTKTYWEVELGHHKDGDFFDKLDKATKVTDVIYIVVNDMQTWEKVKKQVVGYKLKLNQENRKVKLTVYLGTMTQLSKKSAFFQNPDCKFSMG